MATSKGDTVTETNDERTVGTNDETTRGSSNEERNSALDYTPEERANADDSIPDPKQWDDGTHSTVVQSDEADDE